GGGRDVRVRRSGRQPDTGAGQPAAARYGRGADHPPEIAASGPDHHEREYARRCRTIPAKNHTHTSSSNAPMASPRSVFHTALAAVASAFRYRYRGTPNTCGTVRKSIVVRSGASISRRHFPETRGATDAA